MAKFFVVLFASACLLAVAFGDFDFDRVNNRLVRRDNHANVDSTVALPINGLLWRVVYTPFGLFLLVCVATSVG